MTQREIAEHYGFKDKEVVRELLKRAHEESKGNQSLSSEGTNLRKHWRNTNMKTNGYRWKMNCYGIFCNPQKGSEAESEVCRYLPPQGEISYICYV